MKLLGPVREAFEGLETKSLACFSLVGVLADMPTTLPKSRALPGVFGVFEEPNEAKAPDPRPNALDAPGVVDEMEAVAGDARMKEFLVPCDKLSPCFLPDV